MFIKFCLHAVTCFQCLRKALDSARQYPVPSELCEICLPWATAPDGASPAALQDGTAGIRRAKQEQSKKRRMKHRGAITYFPGERCLGRKLRCYRRPFRRSKSMGVMDNLSTNYI